MISELEAKLIRQRHAPPVSRRMIACLAFLLIIQLRTDRPANAGAGPWEGNNGLRMIAQIHRQIRTRYNNPPSDRELYLAAIQGMLNRLDDPYSQYVPPDMHQQMEFVLSEEEIGGIGIIPHFSPHEGVFVQEVLPDSPADTSGLQRGEVIVRIEGASVTLMSQHQVIQRLRGAVGTDITLEVKAENGAVRSVTITRGRLPHPRTVSAYMLDDTSRIGLVRLFIFSEGAVAKVRQAVQDLTHQGMRGLILDLRNNVGGNLEEGIALADLFVTSGILVTTERRKPDTRDTPLRQSVPATNASVTSAPMVVLVNEFTASSSELAAGALQDHKRATLVGTRTTGKGRFQEVLPMAQTGGALVLTVGRYLTPNGRDIQGEGLIPDREVPLDTETARRIGRQWAIDFYSTLPASSGRENATDPQLEEAVRILRDRMEQQEASPRKAAYQP